MYPFRIILRGNAHISKNFLRKNFLGATLCSKIFHAYPWCASPAGCGSASLWPSVPKVPCTVQMCPDL